MNDKTWVVITNDHGRNANKDKLPVICSKLKITHVLISPNLINAGYTVQKEALVRVWTKLMLLDQIPRGTSVRLGFMERRKGIRDFELKVAGKPLLAAIKSYEQNSSEEGNEGAS